MDALLEKAVEEPESLCKGDLAALLRFSDGPALFAAALSVKERTIGRRVSLRGLVEFSNRCVRNCLYCGIRAGNRAVSRYRLDADEILACAARAKALGYGNLVLQSGETPALTDFVEDALRRLHGEFGEGFGITLSCGEQSDATYRRWFEAGAHRYLLRIETSSPELYARLHPSEQSWRARRDCLRSLGRLGYQLGTGTMSALPGQTEDDCAADILFFREVGADMIGMGPYIPHPDTPMGGGIDWTPSARAAALDQGLRMVAVTRLALPDVNIAASTALEALDPEGRAKGLLAGANVIMPNVSPPSRRADYRLYAGKPGVDEGADEARERLARSLAAIGETPLWDSRGDSLRFARRQEGNER